MKYVHWTEPTFAHLDLSWFSVICQDKNIARCRISFSITDGKEIVFARLHYTSDATLQFGIKNQDTKAQRHEKRHETW